VNSRPTSRATG